MSPEFPGYRITTQLGVGARSKISIAVELDTGTRYAVKQVVRNSSKDDPFLAQVEREYEVTRSLEHPYLRRSYHLRRVRKRLQIKELHLLLELVEGLNLEKARPNRLNTFLTIFRRLAIGLDTFHQAGYVHSDIKPTNIMIGQGGIVKIIDFGQACTMGHKKKRIQGTPDYIAPEQVQRMPLDRRTDVFNLGATMYWVLTSENYPTEIRGHDHFGGIRRVTSDKPIAPIELNDKIPVSLSNLVMECCRENPGERPGDMKQVEARLASIQNLWRKYRDQMRDTFLRDPSLPDAREPQVEEAE